MLDPNELIETSEAAAIARQKPQTLVGWRSQGKGPRFVKIGRRCLYRRSVLLEWIAAQERNPEAARAA